MTVADDAPTLPGYAFQALLGRGGYADVYLYLQARPRREVAVKVLRDRESDPNRQAQLTGEADLMALLSAHQNIVTIFHMDVAPDGRQYLVMEYYPGPNLAQRARREQFSVPDVLAIGIQVASAVESAHRLGIIHRDIKPANILTNQYGRPGLTDFGISSSRGATDDDVGMSVPWSAPEVFRARVIPDERCDVYSLGATLWNLLTGRSPFEEPGGDNTQFALMQRIETQPVPSTGRPDVPASLQRVLERAMAKRPEARFATALEFALALQSVQHEGQLALTPVEVPRQNAGERLHPSVPGPSDTSPQDTDWRPRTVDAQPAAPIVAQGPSDVADLVDTGPAMPRFAPAPDTGGTRWSGVSDTQARTGGPPAAGVPAPAEAPVSRRVLVSALAGVVVLVAVVSVIIALLGRGSGAEPDATTSAPSTVQDVLAALPVPEGTAVRQSASTAVFSWSVPPGSAVAGYLLSRQDVGGGAGPHEKLVKETTFTLAGLGAGDKPCLTVRSADDSGATSAPVTICADAAS